MSPLESTILSNKHNKSAASISRVKLSVFSFRSQINVIWPHMLRHWQLAQYSYSYFISLLNGT